MKAYLMYQDRDFDNQQKLPHNEQALTQDLELNILFNVMADKDRFLLEIVKRTVLCSLKNPDEILYRQNILRDCINNPLVVRELYNIAIEKIESEKKYYWGFFSTSPSSILYSSVNLLQMLVDMLKKLRKIADEHASEFESKGFTTLFTMLKKELDDEYFSTLETHINQLKFPNGILISAELGKGNEGINYILCKWLNEKQGWLKWRFAPKLYISDRDDGGLTDLSKRKDRAVNHIANILAQSTKHIISFFIMLRTELAFYVGCLNLYDQLSQKGEPISFPIPLNSCKRRHSFQGLYDICLALIIDSKVIGNDVKANNKDLFIITGANQGGKSTFYGALVKLN